MWIQKNLSINCKDKHLKRLYQAKHRRGWGSRPHFETEKIENFLHSCFFFLKLLKMHFFIVIKLPFFFKTLLLLRSDIQFIFMNSEPKNITQKKWKLFPLSHSWLRQNHWSYEKLMINDFSLVTDGQSNEEFCTLKKVFTSIFLLSQVFNQFFFKLETGLWKLERIL